MKKINFTINFIINFFIYLHNIIHKMCISCGYLFYALFLFTETTHFIKNTGVYKIKKIIHTIHKDINISTITKKI